MLKNSLPPLIQPLSQNRKTRQNADIWLRILIVIIISGASTLTFQVIRLFSPALLTIIQNDVLNIILAILPLVVWLVLTWWLEWRDEQLPSRILPVCFVTFVSAYLLALPVIEQIFTVDQWLPLVSAAERIIGYTFTIGISQSGLVYAVIMLIVWRSHLQNRQDVVTYCLSAAVAFASADNLYHLREISPLVDAAAIRFFDNLALATTSSLIMAYGLTLTKFDSAIAIVLPFTLLLSAILIGAFTPLQTGLTSASLSLTPTLTRPLLGLALTFAILVIGLLVIRWLLARAENRSRQSELSGQLEILS